MLDTNPRKTRRAGGGGFCELNKKLAYLDTLVNEIIEELKNTKCIDLQDIVYRIELT